MEKQFKGTVCGRSLKWIIMSTETVKFSMTSVQYLRWTGRWYWWDHWWDWWDKRWWTWGGSLWRTCGSHRFYLSDFNRISSLGINHIKSFQSGILSSYVVDFIVMVGCEGWLAVNVGFDAGLIFLACADLSRKWRPENRSILPSSNLLGTLARIRNPAQLKPKWRSV